MDCAADHPPFSAAPPLPVLFPRASAGASARSSTSALPSLHPGDRGGNAGTPGHCCNLVVSRTKHMVCIRQFHALLHQQTFLAVGFPGASRLVPKRLCRLQLNRRVCLSALLVSLPALSGSASFLQDCAAKRTL